MDEGGEEEDEGENGFLCLVAEEGAAGPAADDATEEGQPVKRFLRHTPAAAAGAGLVESVGDEGDEAKD